MHLLQMVILACQISSTSCDLDAIRVRENQCQEFVTACFKHMRPVFKTDKDTFDKCLEIKRDVGL